jgi:DNA repair exonuclease SbcCD ATPase subunit
LEIKNNKKGNIMKKSLFFIAIVSFVFSLVLMSCQTRDDRGTYDDTTFRDRDGVTMDTRDTERRVFLVRDRDYTYEERDQYRQDIQQARNEIDNEIQRLERQSADAPAEARDGYNDAIAELRDKRQELDRELNRMNNVTEDNWEEFKSDMNEWFSDLEDDYNRRVNDLRDDRTQIGTRDQDRIQNENYQNQERRQ